jgi:hypothetical protein
VDALYFPFSFTCRNNCCSLHHFLLISIFLFKTYFQDENGNKMVNEYVREYKIGAGSYGKVVSIILMTLFCIFLHQ